MMMMMLNVFLDNLFQRGFVNVGRLINVGHAGQGTGGTFGTRTPQGDNVTGRGFGTDQQVRLLGRGVRHFALQDVQTLLRAGLVQNAAATRTLLRRLGRRLWRLFLLLFALKEQFDSRGDGRNALQVNVQRTRRTAVAGQIQALLLLLLLLGFFHNIGGRTRKKQRGGLEVAIVDGLLAPTIIIIIMMMIATGHCFFFFGRSRAHQRRQTGLTTLHLARLLLLLLLLVLLELCFPPPSPPMDGGWVVGLLPQPKATSTDFLARRNASAPITNQAKRRK